MVIITRTPEKTKAATTITAADIKKQLNIEPTFEEDDAYITGLIDVAIEAVEDDTHADMLDTTNVLEHTVENGVQTIYRIDQAPVRAITKIEKYVNGAWETIDPINYDFEPGFHWFKIYFRHPFTAEKMRFTFTSGYTAAKLPKKLRHAAILKAADLFDTERQGYQQSNIVENAAYSRLIAAHTRRSW